MINISIKELEELNNCNIDKIEWLELESLVSIIKRDTIFAYLKSESGRYFKIDAFDALLSYASTKLSYFLILEEYIVDKDGEKICLSDKNIEYDSSTKFGHFEGRIDKIGYLSIKV
jgi:hypothetical protein